MLIVNGRWECLLGDGRGPLEACLPDSLRTRRWAKQMNIELDGAMHSVDQVDLRDDEVRG